MTSLAAQYSNGATALSWTAPAGLPPGTSVTYSINWSTGSAIGITIPSYTVPASALPAVGIYTFTVTPVINGASGAPASINAFGGTLNPPTLTTIQSGLASLTVNWTDSNTYTDHSPLYTVTATPSQGGTPVVRTATSSPLNMTGLYSGNGYQIVLTASDHGITPGLSNRGGQVTEVYPATSLTASAISATGFTLSWTDPNQYFAGETYTYQVTLNGTLTNCPITSTTCVLTGLAPGTVYNVAVTVVSSSFSTPTSTSVTTLSL